MAVTVQVLEDGPRNYVVHLDIDEDNTAEVIVDASALGIKGAVLEKAEWSFSVPEEAAVLQYSSDFGEQTVLVMAGNNSDEFCYYGGIPFTGLGSYIITDAITVFDYTGQGDAISFTIDGVEVALDGDYTDLDGLVTAIGGILTGYTVAKEDTAIRISKVGAPKAPVYEAGEGDSSEFEPQESVDTNDVLVDVVLNTESSFGPGTAILKFKKKYVKLVEG